MSLPRDPKLEFNSYQHEMLEGLIFSDAHISRSPYFTFALMQTERQSEYVKFVKKELEFNTKISHIKRNNMYITAKCNIVFKEYRERWYPQSKKIIPEDFKLTPTSSLHLYLGDGHYSQTGNIILSTQSFTKENVNKVFLPQLHKLNIECWMQKAEGKNWRVYIPGKYVNTFLEYIGPPPVKCFPQKYEWGL